MKRATDEIFLPQKRPRTDGLQGETARTSPFPRSSSYNSYGPGNQFNAPGGTQNISEGDGPHLPGATFHAPVYFGTQEPVHPLQDCLKSLAFPEMNTRSNDIDTAAKGTCDWLLRHETYTSWASCDRGLLWIKGKPGSGKSTLLRYVLDHVMEIPNTREGALILSFFFHGRGSELQKTPLGLFRSLLHHLLRRVPEALTDFVATFQERCETFGKLGEKWQWHPRELLELFESSLPKVLETRPVWLFVDALDECGQKNAVNLVREFKSLLQDLPSTGSQFHICFTCRYYPILDQTCQFEICLEKENTQDISTYVRAQLSVSRGLTESTIPDLITKHARGVFIWVYLVVDRILDLDNGGAGLKKIEDEIYSIPPDLDDLYRDLIRNVDERLASLKLIQWICFAVRPLSLDELQWAMIVDADCPHKSLQECKRTKDYISDSDRMKRRVQTLSCGLAEVTSDTKVVQFIHQSVKDFFVEKGLLALISAFGQHRESVGNAKADFVVGIAHHRLSRTCIHYLAMEEICRSASSESYRLRSKFPFLHYATTSWVAHTKQSDATSVPQEDLEEYFAGTSNTLMERWVRIYRILETYSRDCPAEGTSLVHVMSRYGVAGALWAILERADQAGINIDGKDSEGRTPLSWAAANGHEAVVRLLLDGGAHTEAADEGGRMPLSRAAENGHEAVVKLLLEKGATIDAKVKDGQTPLWLAAERGYETVVKLLLERGADASYEDCYSNWTPFARAVIMGHEEVVKLMLDNDDTDPDSRDTCGRTPLSWAIQYNRQVIVKLLLARDEVDPDSKDNEGQTLLLTAIKNGHEVPVKLLLERHDVDRSSKDTKYGRTPLSWAAAGENPALVEVLLQESADPKSTDNHGRTVLSIAAARGQEAIVQLLLNRNDIDPNSKDNDGRTPLWVAVQSGHAAVVKLLLGRGADPNSEDNAGQTPLSMAIEMKRDGVVKAILDNDKTDPDLEDIHGQPPLLQAMQAEGVEIIRLLLARGVVNLEPRNKDGTTPLSWAAQKGHIFLVKQFLDIGGVNLDSKDNRGRTALAMAVDWLHEDVAKLLLERGADPNSKDNYGRTALSTAATRGVEKVVQLLLSKSVIDPDSRDNDGRTPLWLAAQHGRVTIARLLLEHGADPNSEDSLGQTPLSIALEGKCKEVVELLRTKAAVNTRVLARKYGMRHTDLRRDNQERLEIIFWLQPQFYFDHKLHASMSQRQNGTGQWFLDSKELSDWLNQKEQILFCPGMPAGGKTIMSSIVIHHLREKFKGDPSVAIAYFYWDCCYHQEWTDLFRGLLSQLLCQQSSIPESVKALYNQHKGTKPSYHKILEALQLVVANYARVFIIIDALDECPDSDGSRTKALSDIVTFQKKTRTSLFATSRPIPEIMTLFHGNLSLEIRAKDEDVRRYLDARIPPYWDLDLQAEVKTKIMEVSDGMFLLARLHLDSLTAARTINSVKSELKQLQRVPEMLDEMYMRTMSGIIEGHGTREQHARRLLSWITFAKRPLTTSEIRHALAIQVGMPEIIEATLPEIDDIISACSGFVTVDSERRVRWVHSMAREWFACLPPKNASFASFQRMNTDIARSCIAYLSLDSFQTGFCPTDEELRAQLRINVLFNYAVENWGHHARGTVVETDQLILDFLENSAKLSAATQAMGYRGYGLGLPKQMTAMHLAAGFGLQNTVLALLGRGHTPDDLDTEGRTPLSLAAENGHDTVVDVLLEHAVIDINSRDKVGMTPLSLAAKNGHFQVVRQILAMGKVSADSKDDKKRTPLSYAAEKGHRGVARMLLTRGKVDANSKSNSGQTPLAFAAANGHLGVVRVLLTIGRAKPNSRGVDHRTPLSYAAERGHKAVVELLIEKGGQF